MLEPEKIDIVCFDGFIGITGYPEVQALGKNRGKFLSPDNTGADQHQQDDTGNDAVVTK